MKKSKKENEIINQLSKEHGKSTLEIKEKMAEAIQSGLSNPDPAVKAEWERLFGKGNQPDMEEFIKSITNSLK